jgi:hypothetical protein
MRMKNGRMANRSLAAVSQTRIVRVGEHYGRLGEPRQGLAV